MHRSGLVLAGLAMALCSLGLAAADEATRPWISPQAQAVRDRVTAARAAIDGWTATIVMESTLFASGSAKTRNMQTTERYLRSHGPAEYYAATHSNEEGRFAIVKCQDLAVNRLVFRNSKGVQGTVSPADAFNRPEFWLKFDLAFTDSDFVRWAGHESFGGQSCDVVEAVDLEHRASDSPNAVTAISTTRFFVSRAGLIERITYARDEKSGQQSDWLDQRITYDSKAHLTPEDFSQASFERDAVAAVLNGQPMPVLKEEVFAVGDTLPEMTFTGWPDGKPFRISYLKGKVVVVETWASWCYFCKEAFPTYEKARRALADQDVVFVAVSFDQKLSDYEKWMKQHAGDYGFKFGRVDAEDPMKAMKEFRGSLPGFYVLGRDGKIVSSYLGFGYGRGNEDPRLLAALRAAGVTLQR